MIIQENHQTNEKSIKKDLYSFILDSILNRSLPLSKNVRDSGFEDFFLVIQGY
jgi:hypothetical protein